MLFCANCTVRSCSRELSLPDGEITFPRGCPTPGAKSPDILAKYKLSPEDYRIARNSAECSPDHSENRLKKTMRFARMSGYEHLGLAFCVTLAPQAHLIADVLKRNGFTVDSVVCKVGREDRAQLGAPANARPMCNPIVQAEQLNAAGTQFNILLGLCVGHDSLFIRHSAAPVTVLACKDHVYDNAPLRCLEESN